MKSLLSLCFIAVLSIVGSVSNDFGQQANGYVFERSDAGVAFDPQHQKAVTYKDQDINVDLIVKGEERWLNVQKQNGRLVRVHLPANVLQVNEIRRVPSNKIVVIGMFNGDVWSVAIISLDQMNVTDNFLCYEPAVSPDGKFIAFIKFFPPHGAEGAEDHYMLYNLARSAAQNRPANVSTTDIKTVGFTIYPFGIGNKEFDNLNRPEDTEHSLASSGFFWSPNSNEVVFADSYKNQTSVVVVQIDSSAKATTKTATIALTCSDNLPEAGNCPVRLVKVSLGRNGYERTFTFRGTLRNSGYEHTLVLEPSQLSILGTIDV